MEKREDGRIYLKSYLKDIVTVRDISQCLEEGNQPKGSEGFEILSQWPSRWYNFHF